MARLTVLTVAAVLVWAAACGAGGVHPRDAFTGELPAPDATTVWTDVLALGVNNVGWPAAERPCPYCRLPTHARAVVTPVVWELSLTATGMTCTFATAASTVWVRFNVTKVESGDWLWPIGGHQGVDVYVSDAATGGANTFRWATSAGNNAHMAQTVAREGGHNTSFTMVLGPMADMPSGTTRNLTVYLPSRGLLGSAEIGVPSTSPAPVYIDPYPDRQPVVLYGTSIVHGAATQRPGMVWSSQLSRLLKRRVINLGFSGNGKMQPGTKEILAELNGTAVFVLDCEWNMVGMAPDEVQQRATDLILHLRAKQPDTPIVLIEGHRPTRGWMETGVDTAFNGTSAGYRLAFNSLIASAGGAEAVDRLFYLEATGKLGGPLATDFEAQVGAVGGVHPSPLAFHHMATYVGGFVAKVLNGTAPKPVPLPIPPHAAVVAEAAGRDSEPAATAAPPLVWSEGSALGYAGNGWPSTAPIYGRFPAAAQQDLEAATWSLSESCSGCLVRFQTNASAVYLNMSRTTEPGVLQDDIMPWNGRFGLDVYAQDTATGKWRWMSTSAAGSEQASERLNLDRLPALAPGETRNFTVYLPTHTITEGLQVGVAEGASLEPLRPYGEGQAPVVIWGSSICQGGVVQNAGMTWPVCLQRLLDRPLLNFGFSGNCRMQNSTAKWIGRLPTKPKVLVVDCLPNMDAPLVTERAVPVVRQLRAALGPDVPIVLLEGHTYTNAWVLPAVASGQEAKRAAQRAAFATLHKDDHNLFYVAGDGKLLSLGAETWYEATAGVGVHPSNLAHLHIAEFVADQLTGMGVL